MTEDGNNVQLVYNDSWMLEAAKKGAKMSKQGKEGVSLLFFTPSLATCLFGGKT